MFQLHSKQNLPISLDQAWELLSNPNNLQLITPPEMGFKIVSGNDRPLFAGQIIEYRVTPLLNISTRWISEITHIEHKKYFIDVQLYGPYSFWQHAHFLKEIEGGVEVEDLIHYNVPAGFLGKWLHPVLVKPKLNEIFNYRKNKLIELYGSFK